MPTILRDYLKLMFALLSISVVAASCDKYEYNQLEKLLEEKKNDFTYRIGEFFSAVLLAETRTGAKFMNKYSKLYIEIDCDLQRAGRAKSPKRG